jgi:hypothetical protein
MPGPSLKFSVHTAQQRKVSLASGGDFRSKPCEKRRSERHARYMLRQMKRVRPSAFDCR